MMNLKVYKTIEIATIIFEIWGTDRDELVMIIEGLNDHNTDRSKTTALSLEFIIEKHCEDTGICPVCFEDDFDTSRYGNGWDEPVEWSYTCKNCGWED